MSRRKRMMEELDRDIREHIERETQDNIERGMSPEDARYAALRKFGNVRRMRENTRAVWSVLWLDNLWQDMRFGARMLRKSPGFTAVAILTLALGIGANTAIFSLVNAVLLESLPVQHPEQLVVPLWFAHSTPENIDSSGYGDCGRGVEGETDRSGCSFSRHFLDELHGHTELFSDVAAFAGPATLDVSGNGAASTANGEFVSGNYFSTLGVRTAAGRIIEPADDRVGATPVLVLNYSYWQNEFGGAPGIVGRTVRLNGVVFEIVGVADPSFTRLTPGKSLAMWVPLSQLRAVGIRWSGDHDTDNNWWLTLIARLLPGVPRTRAEAAASVIFHDQIAAMKEPVFQASDKPRLVLPPAQQGLAGFRTTLGDPLKLLMAAVGIVLLIACANVAGLMLARANSRKREMAVRLTLGAGRSRVIRQLLTESILLSAMGAGFGVLLAVWSAQALAAFFIANSYRMIVLDLHLDMKVLAFTAGIALLAGVSFGLAPAIFGSRVNLSPALKENSAAGPGARKSGRRRFGLGSSVVIVQVALSVVMLVGTGLLLRTLEKLRSINPGFDSNNLVLFTLNPSEAGYKQPATSTLYEGLRDRLAALPGVSGATYSSEALLDGSLWSSGQFLEGMKPDDKIDAQMMAIGPEYFKTMRIALLGGREFTVQDMDSPQHVAIVNEACAKKFPASRNPLGLHIGADKGRSEVIGVVADTKYDDLRKEDAPTIYIPMNDGGGTFAVRSMIATSAMMASIRKVVNETDANLPIVLLRTQSDAIDRLLFNERMLARLSSLFGALALLLTCLGLYGLLAFEVARGTREIGIRMALGAQMRDVLRAIILRGLALAATGGLVGVLVALGVTRYIESMLYGVKPIDALTFISVSALLMIVAIAACWIPARRAMRVDPMVALRYE
ncbi:MAG TPA: ABC transporter permease [Candidatus Acidoferrales bacterium]|nr:ABC transporter permease [Candidatus Acidoferrales bacterium]